MNRIDDNFEKFLVEKVKEEKSQFNTPISFNNKIEDVLNEIDSININKKKKWYENRKYLGVAAAFICLFSLGIIKYTNVYQDSESTVKMARSMDESSLESADIYDNENGTDLKSIINLKNVETIYINGEEIKDKESISELLFSLNNIIIHESNEKFNSEEFKLEIKGEEANTIYMKENLLFIKDTVYQGNTLEVENLRNRIANLINY